MRDGACTGNFHRYSHKLSAGEYSAKFSVVIGLAAG
jgi:hypothetical protein